MLSSTGRTQTVLWPGACRSWPWLCLSWLQHIHSSHSSPEGSLWSWQRRRARLAVYWHGVGPSKRSCACETEGLHLCSARTGFSSHSSRGWSTQIRNSSNPLGWKTEQVMWCLRPDVMLHTCTTMHDAINIIRRQSGSQFDVPEPRGRHQFEVGWVQWCLWDTFQTVAGRESIFSCWWGGAETCT